MIPPAVPDSCAARPSMIPPCAHWPPGPRPGRTPDALRPRRGRPRPARPSPRGPGRRCAGRPCPPRPPLDPPGGVRRRTGERSGPTRPRPRAPRVRRRAIGRRRCPLSASAARASMEEIRARSSRAAAVSCRVMASSRRRSAPSVSKRITASFAATNSIAAASSSSPPRRACRATRQGVRVRPRSQRPRRRAMDEGGARSPDGRRQRLADEGMGEDERRAVFDEKVPVQPDLEMVEQLDSGRFP